MKAQRPHKTYAPFRALILPLLALLLLGAEPHTRAEDFILRQSFAAQQTEAARLNLLIGQSRMIQFDQPIGRLSVSNPEIAEAVIVAADQVLVHGKAFGQVNFIAWDKDSQRTVVFDVSVKVNLGLMEALLKDLFPGDSIQLNQANGSVVLSGKVSDNRKIALAESTVQAAGFKTINLLRGPFEDTPQVQLNVQVAEVNRSKIRELSAAFAIGIKPGQGGFIGSGGAPASVDSVDDGLIRGTISDALNILFLGNNVSAFLRALQTKGALRTLAEPNIVAIDGSEASFLAGGEFPVPIIQGSGTAANVTIVFKEFGIRLVFKPTIADEDHIRLDLLPEVSTIDFSNGVSFGGFRIPALRTRRSKTSIEIKNSQSFVLAGLLDASETKALSKVPLLGDIPILGYAFRSESLQKLETELVFIITAKLVKPIDKTAIPAMPGLDGLKGDKSPLTKTPDPDKEKNKDKDDDDDDDKKKDKDKNQNKGDGSSLSAKAKEKP